MQNYINYSGNYPIITSYPESILNNNFKPILLISGEYNLFNSGFDTQGSYMCSGLYESKHFKLPIYIGGFVKNILEAVEDIVDLYKQTKNLHVKNLYILQYYLAFCQDGSIIELVNSER